MGHANSFQKQAHLRQTFWRLAILGCALASISRASIGGQTLREAAGRAGILIGTAVRPSQFSEWRYASVLAREFNMVEPEDALKWRALRPDRHSYDFRAGDEVVRFAQQHQMKVRGHCLVWGRDNPDWLVQGNFSSRQLSRLLHDHISRVMKHYAGQVFAWDVVNEALDEKGNPRDSIWYNQPGIGFAANGTAYIEQAFRWAHKADPQALLFYNEAEGEDLGRKSDAVYAMVKDFKRRGSRLPGLVCRCTFRASMSILMRKPPLFLRTLRVSQRSGSRYTSLNSTSRCR